ncbi:peptidase S24 LexA-like protein [Campylobacter blaseri]|uniref:HTH cro/C1-type domain-containing protein n=1 Tax=Campylobacter blaseri TaxID=2042961 RepID=A0A2P8R2N7_9BACT|nr:S24 family peptidase [Campylobacter blaseri]PSM52763.1 hypothetical protein CQ405_03300 [Campylobacter blaseri]PSM54411.1 hypothetical protein CRN67_03300 [Campylobacter blaseri]QKF86074.1 peptidase S24 LexA-like protein [Campylobacter blaseri]
MKKIGSGERLKELRKYLKINSQEAFAIHLNTDRSKIADIEAGRTKNIPIDLVIQIVDKFHINGWWLLTGIGSMVEKDINANNYEIEVLDLKAGAGKGLMPFEVSVIGKYILDKVFFKTPQDESKIKIIQVEGDSMEPTIQDGAHVIIDISKKEEIDGIYAILLDDNVIIKRLQFNLDRTITIISDNPKYEPKIYDQKDSQIFFKIIGRKVLVIQK